MTTKLGNTVLRPGEGQFRLTRPWCRNEFQADRFAVQQGRTEALQAALIKLSTDNKSYPYHDWLHSTIHRSHPPLLERLEALKKMQ